MSKTTTATELLAIAARAREPGPLTVAGAFAADHDSGCPAPALESLRPPEGEAP